MPRKEDSIINKIAAAVAAKPGLTGAELSKQLGITTAYRRLSEIRRLGLVRKGPMRTCAVSNKLAVTWLPDDSPVETDRGILTPRQEIKRLTDRVQFLVNENAKLTSLLEHERRLVEKLQNATV